MDLKEAQEMIFRAVENPELNFPAPTLIDAVMTVLVRNELVGAKPKTVTLTFLSQEDD